MANISDTLEADLKALNMSCAFVDDYYNDVDINDATNMYVYVYEPTIEIKHFKLPKNKLVDLNWVTEKLNKNNIYTSFCNDFKKILVSLGYTDSINVYPTSYGIGVFVAFGLRDRIKNIKDDIHGVLNKFNIEYKNERSDAGYVFRFRISKKAENINKLKNILNV